MNRVQFCGKVSNIDYLNRPKIRIYYQSEFKSHTFLSLEQLQAKFFLKRSILALSRGYKNKNKEVAA